LFEGHPPILPDRAHEYAISSPSGDHATPMYVSFVNVR
jgi:hypothetical protein